MLKKVSAKFFSIVLVQLLSIFTCIFGNQVPCPPYWTSFGPFGCFFFARYAGPMDYDTAQEYCQHLYPGGSLAEIHDVKTQYFLMGAITSMGLKSIYDQWWLGADDKFVEGTWYWKSSKKLYPNPQAFHYFGTGEPNNVKEEDCVEMLGLYTQNYVGEWITNYHWNDIGCELKKLPLCHVKLDEDRYARFTNNEGKK